MKSQILLFGLLIATPAVAETTLAQESNRRSIIWAEAGDISHVKGPSLAGSAEASLTKGAGIIWAEAGDIAHVAPSGEEKGK